MESAVESVGSPHGPWGWVECGRDERYKNQVAVYALILALIVSPYRRYLALVRPP